MTTDRRTTPPPCSAERRADDTHWWKAYGAHSSAAVAPVPGESLTAARKGTQQIDKCCDAQATAGGNSVPSGTI